MFGESSHTLGVSLPELGPVEGVAGVLALRARGDQVNRADKIVVCRELGGARAVIADPGRLAGPRDAAHDGDLGHDLPISENPTVGSPIDGGGQLSEIVWLNLPPQLPELQVAHHAVGLISGDTMLSCVVSDFSDGLKYPLVGVGGISSEHQTTDENGVVPSNDHMEGASLFGCRRVRIHFVVLVILPEGEQGEWLDRHGLVGVGHSDVLLDPERDVNYFRHRPTNPIFPP